MAFKVINCTGLDWLSKEYVEMQDIWKLGKDCIWSGIVYSDWHGKNNMNGERFRWWDGHVGPHSLPLILTTSVKYGKSPAMYNCVKCVCICVIVSLMIWFLLVSVDFKTSGRCLLKGGKYVAGTSLIAFHFTAMTKTNKFNGGDFLQVCTSLWECWL